LYGLPAAAVGTVDDVNTSGPRVTFIVRLALVAVFAGLLLSVTCTVNGKEPAVVGEPNKMPFALSEIPGGNEPLATVHVRFPTPPCSRRSCVYGWFCRAFGKTEVVTVMLAGATRG